MTLRDQPEFAELAKSLHDLPRQGSLVYLPNPGNWGDAVIAEGQREFFAHFGIPVKFLRMRWPFVHLPLAVRSLARQMRPVVLYGGGGGLAGHYPELVRTIRIALAGAGKSVVLPSTYGAGTLGALRPASECVLWARDRFESMAHVPGARFCHDMAFFLDLPPITPVAAQGRFFRTDRESLGQGLPEGNRDISFEGTEVTPIQGFFDAIGQFETVHTDRLHVAIVAALLGRRTHLYANGYHKNAAIFRSSLAPFYPNVSYHEFREV